MKIILKPINLSLILSFILTFFYNFTFYSKVLAVYPLNSHNIFFLFTLVFSLFLIINLVLTLLTIPLNWTNSVTRKNRLNKTFYFIILFFSMLAAYFMNSFSTIVDDTMMLNIVKTDLSETRDLLSLPLLFYFIFLFILPAFLIFKTELTYQPFVKDLLNRLKVIGISLLLIILSLASCGKYYASFFREQKPLRYYTNPTYWIYSAGKFGSNFFTNSNNKLEVIGENSRIPAEDKDRELIILVVGETARRDRFSLNGYEKETNPLLKKENVISFTNVTSCGTSTAISVPCMFSHFNKENFSTDKAKYTENLLDVLAHTKKFDILWRDNNSDSKGVAVRAKYEDFKSPKLNTICNPECRDVGMLVGLQEYINQSSNQDILIVLHQMGNHGPAYYKRYPSEFEVFKPVCKTNELEECTNEQINNTYDNAILYTDFFLAEVIKLLKANSEKFETAMLYISDHGESLGENGVYLHGLPYMVAPKEQKEVPLIMWFGGAMEEETNYTLLKQLTNKPFSHVNIFHTVLGIAEIESTEYIPDLNILNGVQIPQF